MLCVFCARQARAAAPDAAMETASQPRAKVHDSGARTYPALYIRGAGGVSYGEYIWAPWFSDVVRQRGIGMDVEFAIGVRFNDLFALHVTTSLHGIRGFRQRTVPSCSLFCSPEEKKPPYTEDRRTLNGYGTIGLGVTFHEGIWLQSISFGAGYLTSQPGWGAAVNLFVGAGKVFPSRLQLGGGFGLDVGGALLEYTGLTVGPRIFIAY